MRTIRLIFTLAAFFAGTVIYGDTTELTLQTWNGQNIALQADDADTVADVKSLAEDTCGVPATRQQLWFNGRELEDAETCAAAGVHAGDVVEMMLDAPWLDAAIASNDDESVRLTLHNLTHNVTDRLERSYSLLDPEGWEGVLNFTDGWGPENVLPAMPTGNNVAVFYRLLETFPTNPLPPISHGTPVLHPADDYDLRQLEVVATDAGHYWIGMRGYVSASPSGIRLMQVDAHGRTLIPPFSLSAEALGASSNTDENYAFDIVPLAGGGLQVLVSEEDPDAEFQSDPNLFRAYHLAADGSLAEVRDLMYIGEYDIRYYQDIQAYRTEDNRTLSSTARTWNNPRLSRSSAKISN